MATKPLKKQATRRPRLKHVVCKPCWELRYCPYGPLVEFFPLPSDELPLGQIRKSYRSWIEALRNGMVKSERGIRLAIQKTLCLEPKRWAWISEFKTDELCCSVFGHICPVFFSAQPFTETKEDRRISRHIPREVMLKVVRRDGQVCRACHRNVPDDQIEFDHVIPQARGGPTTAENLRILCRACNRQKGQGLKEILAHDPLHK